MFEAAVVISRLIRSLKICCCLAVLGLRSKICPVYQQKRDNSPPCRHVETDRFFVCKIKKMSSFSGKVPLNRLSTELETNSQKAPMKCLQIISKPDEMFVPRPGLAMH